MNIAFLTPAGMQDTDVTSDVILAETVIVGSVPETFLQLNWREGSFHEPQTGD